MKQIDIIEDAGYTHAWAVLSERDIGDLTEVGNVRRSAIDRSGASPATDWRRAGRCLTWHTSCSSSRQTTASRSVGRPRRPHPDHIR